MTGFARVRKSVPQGEIVLSIKSVNHRALDLHFRMPAELEASETALRAAVKGRVARGHLQIQLLFNRTAPEAGAHLNRPLLEAYLGAFRHAAEEFKLEGTPDLNTALSLPGMFRAEPETDLEDALEPALVEAMEEALDALNAFREREGRAVAAEVLDRCRKVRELAERMEEIRSHATQAFQKRLQERLKELLRGVGLEPQRIAQEAAVLADRSDVSEELMRLKTHAGQVEKLLSHAGEVGKRLDFLLQEMNREANTVLSKTGGLGDLGLTMTDLALAAKSEIDKMREHSLNLE
jgi:uncharacterized protein (TIGR00255 family)